MKDKKYILITKDLHNSLIEFLDEIQFDIAGNDDKESLHKVNFISWAVGELVNSFEAYFPKKKSREDYVDETFMDWNLPEMNDEDYEKLVDQVDGFLKGWEKEYNKKNPKKKSTKELSNEEAFDLYYEEHRRVEDDKNSMSYDELLRKSGLKPPIKN